MPARGWVGRRSAKLAPVSPQIERRDRVERSELRRTIFSLRGQGEGSKRNLGSFGRRAAPSERSSERHRRGHFQYGRTVSKSSLGSGLFDDVLDGPYARATKRHQPFDGLALPALIGG